MFFQVPESPRTKVPAFEKEVQSEIQDAGKFG